MPLDAICLSAIRIELEKEIVGLRIDKVQQPERDELLLSIRGFGRTVHLLISAGTGNARVHLTDAHFENPQTPPMFCMLMRKHITGAKIAAVTQPPFERVIDFQLDAVDAMGVSYEKHLILELMGRYSNIILTGSDGVIIDCLRRVDTLMSEKRQILPGLLYRLPPTQGKLEISDVSELEFYQMLRSVHKEKTVDKWLLDTFSGFSPLICRELVCRAYGETDLRLHKVIEVDGGRKLAVAFSALKEVVIAGRFVPWMLIDSSGKPRDFSYMEIVQYEGIYTGERADSFSMLLDEYYTRRDKAERVRQRGAAITKTVRNALDRAIRKLAVQSEELKTTTERERMRQFGDIITANLYQMQKGMTELHTVDFYSPDNEICVIPLDPLKTPQQNAAKYYKNYTKAKTAEKYLTEQIRLGRTEVAYLESVLEEISKAEGERDLSEIRQELIDSGYIRKPKTSKKDRRVEQRPMHFVSSSGMDIWVGKNNAQNDRLTLKTAFKSDMWLHTQKIHGSHVIISCGGSMPDERTLTEAAELAAYYSQGRDSANVPVDYTPVKFVKKPAGSRPGMVIYTNYKTLYVTPDENVAERLRMNENQR
jgi:predicted ribosome quality control (RQC) complex YloA/Tae2 family protein